MLCKMYMGYVVYSNGRIESVDGKVKKTHVRKDGYSMVTLYDRGKCETVLIHRLVAKLFIPNPGHFKDVHHKDGNKHNNDCSNLEWVSRRGNMIAHCITAGKCTQIESEDPSGTVTKYHSINEAARRTDMCSATISRLARSNAKDSSGRTWRLLNET